MKIFVKNDFQSGTLYSRVCLVLPYLSMVVFVILLAFLSFKREVLSYGTESDFVGTFVPEGMRFLNGDSLHVKFHPPFYSIILALVYCFTGDWMRSGLILSVLSSLLVLISCYECFRLKFTNIAAIGGVLALVTSETFISYSMQATSDVFFMALFFSALAFIALAEVKDIMFSWFLAGILIGAVIITRTNGIVLIGFLLFATIRKSTEVSKTRALVLHTTGILIPTIMWVSFAIYSGSPIFPSSNYENLALTYFSESSDRGGLDSRLKASQGLTNTWQVLTKDPVQIANTYIHDLLFNIQRMFSKEELLPFPFIQLALPGLFVLIFREFNKFNRVLAFNLLGMFLFLNFKAWEDRYYLYLVAFMGAGVVSLLALAYSEARKKSQNTIIFVLALFLLFSLVFSIRQIKNALDYRFANLSFDSIEASKIIKNRIISKNAIVILRKPHLRFYSGLDSKLFPDVESIEDLKSALKGIMANQPDDREMYLFYGYAERLYRPKLVALGSLNLNSPWLHRVGWGNENGGWILYEVLRDRL